MTGVASAVNLRVAEVGAATGLALVEVEGARVAAMCVAKAANLAVAGAVAKLVAEVLVDFFRRSRPRYHTIRVLRRLDAKETRPPRWLRMRR